MAGMYAVYHGPSGIKLIAERIHGLAILLADSLKQLGYEQLNESFFDTLKFELGELAGPIHAEAINSEMGAFIIKVRKITISIDGDHFAGRY